MSEPTTPKTLEEAQEVIAELTADRDKWKSNSRKNEERAEENFAARQERDELNKRIAEMEAEKAGSLTEAEKVAKRLADLKAQVQSAQDATRAAEVSALKARIGAEKGLAPGLIDRLQGEDETSIAADADALLAVAKPSGSFVDIGQGQRGSATPQTQNPVAKLLADKLGIPNP
jgi:chromosome segregation ATPase